MTGTSGDDARNTYLFQHLIAMFQTLALQQMGKLINPITGKLERDLQQARITIDMLQMLREKTAGNLSEDERRLLENVVVELQMNFVDEVNRDKDEGEDSEEKSGGEKDGEDSGKAGSAQSESDAEMIREDKKEEKGRRKRKSRKKSVENGE